MSDVKNTESESKASHPEAAKVDGHSETPEQAAKAVIEQRKKEHQQERDDLKKRQENELKVLDPDHFAVDTDAFDATKPRGPEADNETLKPSQRQGEGIDAPGN